MKKFSFFFSLATLSLLSLASCLSSSSQSSGSAVGVYRATGSQYYTPIFNSSLGPVFSESMETIMEDGKCYLINWIFDSDAADNSYSMLELNGYYTITVNYCEAIDTYQAKTVVTDTAKALENEVPVLKGYAVGSSGYVDGHIFITQTVSQPEDMVLDWDLSFDYYAYPASESDRHYDIFIRATYTSAGTGNVKQVEHVNAFNIGNFLSDIAEREYGYLGNNYSADNSTFRIRFFYVTSISDDDKLTWTSVDEDVLISNYITQY
jgi:hypothetical protein